MFMYHVNVKLCYSVNISCAMNIAVTRACLNIFKIHIRDLPIPKFLPF